MLSAASTATCWPFERELLDELFLAPTDFLGQSLAVFDVAISGMTN